MKFLAVSFIVWTLGAPVMSAPCTVMNSDRSPSAMQSDGLYWILNGSIDCPQNIMELEAALENKQWQLSSYMVANRGRLNPHFGSFSFFEVAHGSLPSGNDGEIFVGHFTDLQGTTIVLDQAPARDKLMIEAIAFDEEKGMYNFYELIGAGTGAQWFYRGDSKDALSDNKYLHRKPPSGEAKFGKRMRCSACHNSGGPIMKELAAPHNDWWRQDLPLVFEPNRLSAPVQNRVARLKDASELADAVRAGLMKLSSSDSYMRAKRSLSLPEMVRPLFCATEINLASSEARLKATSGTFAIPSAFIINPLLGMPLLRFKTSDYGALLDRFRLKFPETNEKDADHIWLTPVASEADLNAIRSLIETGVISRKIALDILMIDFTTPLFSKKRCDLLQLVPNDYSDDWLNQFKTALSQSHNLPEAGKLLSYMENKNSFAEWHEEAIETYARDLQKPGSFERLFKLLLVLRKEVSNNEISKNPLGRILEPGFRVIFPEQQRQ